MNLPIFLYGVGTAFEIAPAQAFSSTQKRSDRDALLGDWLNVGNDIKKSMQQVSDEQEKQKSAR